MTLAICFGGLALCGFALVLLYGHELRRMAPLLLESRRALQQPLDHRNARTRVRRSGSCGERARWMPPTARARRAAEQRQFQRDLASLSHDIRTPLMGAKGYVSLAAEEPDDARRAHYLQAAEARLADMEGLLDALFAYARATDAASDLDRRPLVVLPVLADVLTGQFPAFEERGWEPLVDFPDESLVVEADSEALARMFENLVSNALRYGTSAPSIIQRGRTLTFSNKVPDPAAIDVNRLFERFYRADVARAQGGAGLGLAVVASLATAQNIEVEASLEGDELFLTLVFPATP